MRIANNPGIYWLRDERGRFADNPEKVKIMYLPKATRAITLIVIHCTATLPYIDVGAQEVNEWHKARGWTGIGYHGIIRRDGTFEPGRDINTSGAHARGHNRGSIGISLVGGLDMTNRPYPGYTRSQWSTLKKVIAEMREYYPQADIVGHNTLSAKACPSFNVAAWLADGTVKVVR